MMRVSPPCFPLSNVLVPPATSPTTVHYPHSQPFQRHNNGFTTATHTFAIIRRPRPLTHPRTQIVATRSIPIEHQTDSPILAPLPTTCSNTSGTLPSLLPSSHPFLLRYHIRPQSYRKYHIDCHPSPNNVLKLLPTSLSIRMTRSGCTAACSSALGSACIPVTLDPRLLPCR
ncbi:hypothetical protein P691DRAFT_734896 [Macrolepiota fuliginosa MF-IS2]|uniref:Uncharacterized protein n=1 Tax=Macrolepiota fuliginosa MF-IS2 TaxID=1400762 RepID=A0A9P6C1L7_9AGAR|nr:hypothetical protein P691DRAFT_734896 [Macrolepiota fuliginosa MF-IS2]